MPRNQKSGAAKRRRRRDTLENDAHQWVVHRTDAREFFPVLVPQDIIDQIFSPANLPDPADLANLTAVNRGIRDAVVATGRKVEELNSVKAAELGCLRTLQCLLRQGRLEKSLVCSAAARGGHLEELKWGIAEGCQYAEETHAAAASSGNLAVLQYLHGKGCLPLTPLIVTQPDDRSDAVSLGSPEARGRFLVTPQTNICLGTMYIVFY